MIFPRLLRFSFQLIRAVWSGDGGDAVALDCVLNFVERMGTGLVLGARKTSGDGFGVDIQADVFDTLSCG